jgi:16S rRNA (uracil1498-N3)-methyltransferase
MHHFFISPDQIKEQKIVIKGTDVNHIKNVLRMKINEEILVSDGEGNDYHCRIEKIEEDNILAGILDQEFSGSELGCRFFLFQGLPKSDKMEMIIQKAVELGVYEVIPVENKKKHSEIGMRRKRQQNGNDMRLFQKSAANSLIGMWFCY